MKISIVTPSWNQGRFLPRCLESIRIASGVEIEHIVLDNCSDDETPQLLAEFAGRDDGVERRFIIEKDEGQTRAINDGLRLATGDIVCWLNTDEWYAKETLAIVADYFLNNPKVDVLYGNCDFVDKDGQIVKRRRSFEFHPGMLLYYGCYISSCATFLRRRVIDDNEMLNPEFRVAMDYEWYTRLMLRGYRFAHIPISLASFTWHENNISTAQRGRSLIERRMIQQEYSKVLGPNGFRYLIFAGLGIYWRLWRGVRRLAP